MRASPAPGAPTRLERARAAVMRVRAAVPDVPGRARRPDRPRAALPLSDARRAGLRGDASPFGRLRVAAAAGRSTRSRRRSTRSPRSPVTASSPPGSTGAPASSSPTARAGRSRRATWRGRSGASAAAGSWRPRRGSPGERIFRSRARIEALYRPDDAARSKVERLAAVAGGTAFDESSLDEAAAAVRTAAEAGPTARRGTSRGRTRSRPSSPRRRCSCSLGASRRRLATASYARRHECLTDSRSGREPRSRPSGPRARRRVALERDRAALRRRRRERAVGSAGRLARASAGRPTTTGTRR